MTRDISKPPNSWRNQRAERTEDSPRVSRRMMTKVKEELNDLAGFNYKTMANRNAHNGPFGAVRTTQFVTDVQIINNELADFTVNTRQLFRCTGPQEGLEEEVCKGLLQGGRSCGSGRHHSRRPKPGCAHSIAHYAWPSCCCVQKALKLEISESACSARDELLPDQRGVRKGLGLWPVSGEWRPSPEFTEWGKEKLTKFNEERQM